MNNDANFSMTLAVTRHVGFVFSIAVIISALLFVPSFLSETYTYHRWDNLEYFVPIFKWAHGNWINGSLPAINLSQHLGEPFGSNVQAGFFYPTYFLAVLIAQVFTLTDNGIIFLVLLANLTVGSIGFYCIARNYSLPHLLALAISVTSQVGAYNLAYSGVWVTVTSVMAWLPWAILGLIKLSEENLNGGIIFSLSLGLIGLNGHPQFWLYSLVFLFFFSIFIFPKDKKNLLYLFVFFSAGVLISCPAMIPLLAMKGELVRVGSQDIKEFFALSASWRDLLGIFTPFTGKPSTQLSTVPISILTFQGAFVVPLVALIFLFPQKIINKSILWGALFCGALFFIFALGDKLPIYGWTYHIPVWSSFRWPSKFLLFVQICLSILSMIGLFILLKIDGKKQFVARVIIFVLTVIWLLLAKYTFNKYPFLISISTLLLTFSSSALLISMMFLKHKSTHYVFFISSIIATISLNGMIHDINLKNYNKNYSHISYQFQKNTRVMPTSVDSPEPYSLSNLNLGMAATENNYLSLTGYTHTSIPKSYQTLIPSNIFGDLKFDWVGEKLRTNFLDFFGINYILSNKKEYDDAILDSKKYKLINVADGINLYKRIDEQEIIFFAKETVRNHDWSLPKTHVYSEMTPLKRWGSGKIFDVTLSSNGDIKILGYADEESLLVITFLNLPGWSLSINGGERLNPITINNSVMGVIVSGNFSLEANFSPPGLFLGFISFFLGLSLLGFFYFFIKR